jgi:hypothetical protein
LAGAALLAATPLPLAGCAMSHFSSPFGSSDTASSAPAPVSEDRLLANARSDSGSDTTAAVGASAHCPQVVAWPQDRLVTIYQPGKVGDSLSIVHRGEITKLARECQLYGDRMVVRYGFAGRVLLGPKGSAGTVTLPVSVRVASADQKVISTDAVRVATTIPQGNPVGYFSMVKEVSFPIAMGTRPEDYKIFVGLQRTQAGAG